MMNLLAQFVLAQAENTDAEDRREVLERANKPVDKTNIGRVFQEHWDSSELVDVNLLLVAACILFGILLIMYSVRTYKQRNERAHPLTTFNHIAAELKLSMADKLLLIRIARRQDLPTPLTLLLSPVTLRRHAKSFAADLGPAARHKVIHRVRQIRRRLV